jgi:transcription elongation factor Elf1
MIVTTFPCPQCSCLVVVEPLDTQANRAKPCGHCNATFTFTNSELEMHDVTESLIARGYFLESEL